MEEIEKLKILLGHWIEHNASHGEEFERWAGRAREAGLEAVGRSVAAAAASMEEANRCLGEALDDLNANPGGERVPE